MNNDIEVEEDDVVLVMSRVVFSALRLKVFEWTGVDIIDYVVWGYDKNS